MKINMKETCHTFILFPKLHLVDMTGYLSLLSLWMGLLGPLLFFFLKQNVKGLKEMLPEGSGSGCF
jgi:hypothetical protein